MRFKNPCIRSCAILPVIFSVFQAFFNISGPKTTFVTRIYIEIVCTWDSVYLAECLPDIVCTWDSVYLKQCVPGSPVQSCGAEPPPV